MKISIVGINIFTIVTFIFFQRCTTGPQSGNNHHDSTVHIRIKAMQGLRYDVVRFKVQPGADVKVTLRNMDDIDHNLVFTKPGKRKDVLGSAMQLGTKGPEMHYVPASSIVLWHITTLKPGDSQTITFTAPERKGIYPYVCTYPGHGVTMYGVMYVTDKQLPPLKNDANVPHAGKKQMAAHMQGSEKQQLHPYHVAAPYLIRTFMPECGPAAIAVSLPNSLSCCWDAGSCSLRYAWTGAFLKKADLWQRKGNETAQIGGSLFFKTRVNPPFRIGNKKNKPDVKFKGYQLINRYPEFHYQMNGLDVYELIKSRPDGSGIDCHFRIPDANKPVIYIIAPANKEIIEASAGKRMDNALVFSAEQAHHFTISIVKKTSLSL